MPPLPPPNPPPPHTHSAAVSLLANQHEPTNPSPNPSNPLSVAPPSEPRTHSAAVSLLAGLPRLNHLMVGNPPTPKRVPSSRCLSASTWGKV